MTNKENHVKKLISLIAISFIIHASPVFAEHGEHHGDHHEFRQGQKEKKKAFWSEQKAENKEFRQGLKDLPPEQRTAAVAQHRETQFGENKAFREKIHSENTAFLKDKLANNKKLTETEKTDLINFLENQHQENVSFRDQRHSANMAFFEKIANDSSLTQEQKKQAIKDHMAQQKSENKAHREEQKSNRKEFKNTLKNPAE